MNVRLGVKVRVRVRARVTLQPRPKPQVARHVRLPPPMPPVREAAMRSRSPRREAAPSSTRVDFSTLPPEFDSGLFQTSLAEAISHRNFGRAKKLRVQIFQGTLHAMREGYRIAGQAISVPPPLSAIPINAPRQLVLTEGAGPAPVVVVDGDTLGVARHLLLGGFSHVSVLNMASAARPGGGVWGGSAAQEESLCRRSNLWAFLEGMRRRHYPLPVNGGLVSPGVTVFRGTESQGYPFLLEPFNVSVISAAAEHISTRSYTPTQRARMDALAKSIVKMVASDAAAARRQQRQAGVLAGDMRCATVLGALGCGAFKNPPEEVADAFAVALRELAMRQDDGDAGVDLVAFAIVNDHNSPQGGNLAVFQRVFPGSMLELFPAGHSLR